MHLLGKGLVPYERRPRTVVERGFCDQGLDLRPQGWPERAIGVTRVFDDGREELLDVCEDVEQASRAAQIFAQLCPDVHVQFGHGTLDFQ